MLAKGNARICALGDHCGISTAATFCHVKHFISTFLQPTKRDRPILHTSSGDPPALQHSRTSHNRRARRRGRSGLSGVNGHGPALAAEVGGSGQTPGGALHRRGQRAGLSGGGKPGHPGASPLLFPPQRTEEAAAPLPGSHFPREPRPPRGSSPTPVLTALRGGDAAQPPRRAASTSASARRGRRAAPGCRRGGRGASRAEYRGARARAPPGGREDRAARSLGGECVEPARTFTPTVDSCLSAQGHGAKGDNIYEFQIEFLEPVEPKPVCRVTQRQLNITVQKKESNWWERLTKQEKRPLFLAPDFDRWLDESDAEMELKEKEEEKINKMKIESRVPKDPFKHLKKGYLIMYNLVQFLGFSWIFVNMTVRLFILGKDSFYDTFHTIADMMYFCQTLALMEIVNSLIGLVRSPLIPAVVQIFGRNFILFVVLGSVEEMQSKAVVFFVFYFWSIIELFRYPYYMLSCIGIEWKPLTWLRYTAWIPLYPLGGLAEAVCIVQSIPIFSETGKFSLGLPNPLNVTIQFSFLLQIYLIALFLGVFVNFRHLYKQRKQHLGPKKRKMK
ncbi:PREDICTED: very-long-chain (3R)-3-hydroxyacyl-CoA dehydratase 3 [Charadrius vociferus]|nr:PREDICTED: very-long-chain (3R)-3-hydroxyacyl-CoA dehydratase 3 [Charadrius vociferus]